MSEDGTARRVRELLAAVKPLAAEYCRLTGKPLGVTGEVAEYVAAETLGLDLAPARTSGYDAIRRTPGGVMERIQIKGRAYGADAKPGQRLGTIRRGADCDVVLLVLLDSATLAAREMWEARYDAVLARLDRPGSRPASAVSLAFPSSRASRAGSGGQPIPQPPTKRLPRKGGSIGLAADGNTGARLAATGPAG